MKKVVCNIVSILNPFIRVAVPGTGLVSVDDIGRSPPDWLNAIWRLDSFSKSVKPF